ncbi:MAG: hypothetical protein SynsKO_14670 [Synoicihabitans sp.]
MIFLAIKLIQRTIGKEHRIIKSGVIMYAVCAFIYMMMLVLDWELASQLAELGVSIATLYVCYGAWLFLNRIKPIKESFG